MRLSKDENVAKGYAVSTPSGRYVKPSCMNAEMKNLVDSGYVKVTEWGKVETTDKYEADIKALVKPIPQNITKPGFDRMLEAIEIDDIHTLRNKITSKFPSNPVSWFLEDKPAELVALEKTLQAKLDAYWTPERKAIAKANKKAQDAYETAVVRIENRKSDVEKAIAKSESYILSAIERRNNPELAKSQNKIAAIIEDKKRSSSQKVEAIFDGSKSAGASHNAKRTIVLAIAKFLGKGFDKDSIFAEIAKMDEFSALAYKRPEKEFNRIYKDTTSWIHYKNQIKVFYDLLGWVAEGIANTKIRKDNKSALPGLLTLVALHQAKDNDSRGLVAFRYLTRITVVSAANFELDPSKTGRKLEAYAAQNYITYAKGVQGGISSRAGLLPYSGTLSVSQIQSAKEAILNSFQDSAFKTALENVLSRVTVVSAANSVSAPAYDDQDVENAVASLLEIFVPMTRTAADDRIAERHLDEIDWKAEAERFETERTERINAYLATGVGFQPRKKASLALSD